MRTRKAFTLIELLVVIAIIGLLATLAVIAVSSARLKARDARRISDIKQIQNALDLFATDKSGYPKQGDASASALEIGSAAAKRICEIGGFASVCTGGLTYMESVPANPIPGGADYEYRGVDCVGGDVCNDYRMTFTLEGPTGGLAGGACAATSAGMTCP